MLRSNALAGIALYEAANAVAGSRDPWLARRGQRAAQCALAWTTLAGIVAPPTIILPFSSGWARLLYGAICCGSILRSRRLGAIYIAECIRMEDQP